MMDGGNGFTSWSLFFEKTSLPCLSPLPLYLPNQLAETKVVQVRIYTECESEISPSVRFSERGENMECTGKNQLWSAGWFEIGQQLEHFVGGRNASGDALALDAGQVLAHSQSQ